MKIPRQLARDERGAVAIEMSFALPVLIVFLWAFVQLAQVYSAMAGIQQALGQGARYATLCLNPTPVVSCTAPTPAKIKKEITASVYGTGAGTFTIADPVSGIDGTSRYLDLKVQYSQPTSLLLAPGPTINISRSKRVWIAAS
ncbi:MAG: pilus assembly protein [Pseudomonadota bacterium]|nr:pilus assembly protein [Pseudomonadota bacterium]